jgi:hypothetical protein
MWENGGVVFLEQVGELVADDPLVGLRPGRAASGAHSGMRKERQTGDVKALSLLERLAACVLVLEYGGGIWDG